MDSSADSNGAIARVGAMFRLLMQLRLLLVGVTLLLFIGTPITVSSALAIAAAAFTSWLGAHYWQRIMARVVRHPLLLGLDVVVALTVLEFGGPLGPFFLFTVVTSAVAGLLFRWYGVAYFCTLQILCYYAALATAMTDAWPSFQAFVGQPAYYPLVGFLGVRLRRFIDEQARTTEARRQAEVAAAAAEERTRLARELHDSLAKTLRGIGMSARALPMWVERSPQRAADEAKRIAAAAETGSREARELVSDLRSDQLDQQSATLIRRTVEDWAGATGISVRIDIADDVELTLLGRYEATAVLKEALTNIERHADAGSVEVVLASDGEQGVLEVHDDGRGFEPGGGVDRPQCDGHYGLIGMRERAARADGSVSVTSTSGRGTLIRVAFPLAANTHATSETRTEPTTSGIADNLEAT